MEFQVEGPILKFVDHVAALFVDNTSRQNIAITSAVNAARVAVVDGAGLDADTLKEIRTAILDTEALINNLDNTLSTDVELQTRIDAANTAWDAMDSSFRAVLQNVATKAELTDATTVLLTELTAYADTANAGVLNEYGQTFKSMASALPGGFGETITTQLPVHTLAMVPTALTLTSDKLASVVVADNPESVTVSGIAKVEDGVWRVSYTVPLSQSNKTTPLTLRATSTGGDRHDVVLAIETRDTSVVTPTVHFYGSNNANSNALLNKKIKYPGVLRTVRQALVDEVLSGTTDDYINLGITPIPADPYGLDQFLYVGFYLETDDKYVAVKFRYEQCLDVRPHAEHAVTRLGSGEVVNTVYDIRGMAESITISTADMTAITATPRTSIFNATVNSTLYQTMWHTVGNYSRKLITKLSGPHLYVPTATVQRDFYNFYDVDVLPNLTDKVIGDSIDSDWVVIHKDAQCVIAVPTELMETVPISLGMETATIPYSEWVSDVKDKPWLATLYHYSKIKLRGGPFERVNSPYMEWLLAGGYHYAQLPSRASLIDAMTNAVDGTPLHTLREAMRLNGGKFALGGLERISDGTFKYICFGVNPDSTITIYTLAGSDVAIPMPVRIFRMA